MPHPIVQPLRFEPYLRPMVWGGRNLARFLGKNLPTAEPYGESWEVSDHPMHASRLGTASGHGVTLRDLMDSDCAALLGKQSDRHSRFPWLIKLLDARDWLSVQVHPNDDDVKSLWPGESGKTEAWYILDASPQSRIYAGLLPGVGPHELRAAMQRGAVADCLHAFTPRPGDFVFLPAGTVHAVGGGVVLVEIQQTSDATFRLFDWNRRDAQGKTRALHLDQAFACIDWNQGPVTPIPAASAVSRPLVACPYFAIEQVHWTNTVTLGGVEQLQALIMIEGHGRFANGEFAMPGDAWVLPAAMPSITLNPDVPLTGLLCSLPA
jgi:mannose-6-phosphate isomerase